MDLSRVWDKKPVVDRRDLFDTSSTTRTSKWSSGLRRGVALSGGWETARRYAGWGLGLSCVVIVLLSLVDRVLTAGEIHAGVEVGSARLGGKTLAEARELLEAGPARSVREIEAIGPEGARLTAGEMGVSLDVEKTLDQAYAVGRGESTPGRLGERLLAALIGRPLAPEISYDPEEARASVEGLVADLDQETKEANVRVEGDEVEVGEGTVGRRVDLRATVENMEEAAREGRNEALIAVDESEPEVTTAEAEAAARRIEEAVSGPVVLMAGEEEWAITATEVGGMLQVEPKNGRIEVSLDAARVREGLSEVYEGLTAEPVEAGYVVEDGGLAVTESREGKQIEEEQLLGKLEAGLFEGEKRFEVPVTTAEPELTTEEAEDQKPTTLLGRYRTNYLTYDDGPGRVENLRIASGAVSGTTLAPGEVFSFNEIAEPLDYYETQVIVDGQVDYADGGGLCQVASTLYMAANYAGLRTVERHPHYSELPYIQSGFDATVWFGSLDLKLKNNTGNPLLFLEWVDENGYVNAEVWGQPTGKRVEMASQLTATYADAEGNPVTQWVTYRKVTKDGEVTSDGPIHTDTYGYLKP